jgi:hypothetical protein
MNTPSTLVVARESLIPHLRTAVLMTVVLTVLLGIIYPLLMTGISQVLFNNQANGTCSNVHRTIEQKTVLPPTRPCPSTRSPRPQVDWIRISALQTR